MTVESTTLDASAISLSGLCTLHCLALPIIVSLLPASMIWLESEWVHSTLVLTAVPITLYAVLFSNFLNRREHILFATLALLGIAILCSSAFVESLHQWEKSFTLAGAIILSLSHLGRWTKHRAIS